MRTYKHLITYQQNKDKTETIGDKPFNYQATIIGHIIVGGLNKILTIENVETIIEKVQEKNNNSNYVIILNDILLGDEDIE